MMQRELGNGRPVILVTGGAGYIGSRLIRDIAADAAFAGYTVRIFDNLYREHFISLMDLKKDRFEFIHGDILDRINLERALRGVVAVVHLASIVRTPLEYNNPTWVDQINHWGTQSVVEACLEAGVERFVYASSASVYGAGGPFEETDLLKPLGAYPRSKIRGEREVRNGELRGLKPTILRLASVFGSAPAMRFEVVTSRFVYLAGTGQPLTIYGEGTQVRPLIHVEDASQAVLHVLKRDETVGEVYNVAAYNPSVRELADTIIRIRPGARVRYTDQDTMNRISYEIDSTRLAQTGFQHKVSLEQGLREMLDRWRLMPFQLETEFDFN